MLVFILTFCLVMFVSMTVEYVFPHRCGFSAVEDALFSTLFYVTLITILSVFIPMNLVIVVASILGNAVGTFLGSSFNKKGR